MPLFQLSNLSVIWQHLGFTSKPLQRRLSSCINSTLSTVQTTGLSMSKSIVTCSGQCNPASDFSSPLPSHSNTLLPHCQSDDAAQTDKLLELSSQRDDDFVDVYSIPTSFGKKQSLSVTANRNTKTKKRCRRNCVEPFDICLSTSEAILAESSGSEDLIFLRSPTDVESGTDSPKRELIGEPMRRVLRPGMVLLKKYLSPTEQVSIVTKCRELGLGPGGFYQPSYKDGAKLRLLMMCLGMDWDPQTRKYEKRRRIDRAKPPNIPLEFRELVNRSMQDSLACIRDAYNLCNPEKILPQLSSDVCIVNFYTETGRLGLHQDRDESDESLSEGMPVISFSIGDAAEFLYGDHRDVNKAEKLVLESGDVLIFGGDSRHVFHGISSIIPNSAPEFLLKEPQRLRPGRLNLTFRKY